MQRPEEAVIRAVLITLALDALVILSFFSYVAGVTEGVTPRHRSDQPQAISR